MKTKLVLCALLMLSCEKELLITDIQGSYQVLSHNGSWIWHFDEGILSATVGDETNNCGEYFFQLGPDMKRTDTLVTTNVLTGHIVGVITKSAVGFSYNTQFDLLTLIPL